MVGHLEEKIVLYTSNHCKKSDSLRELFTNWGIPFTEKNTSENRAFLKELQKKGIYGTPTTFIGDAYIEGMQEQRLKNLLKK